jgi:ABC-type transport system involved in multi-copper enzyme maturation permease subunit
MRRSAGWLLAFDERLADVVFLAGGLGLAVLALWQVSQDSATAPRSSGGRVLLAVLAVAWLIALAVFHQRGSLRLFGPLLYYDLIRTARRTRYLVFRFLYALFLALVLGWIYLIWFLDSPRGSLTPREMATFAETFFYTFIAIQFVTLSLLTPAYTAGAVAEEKERRTLDFILATDLGNREIVLSKLTARLFHLALLALVGLPILSFLQFLGGVDPNLLLAAFAMTLATVVSLSCLSLFNSVLTRRARDAITVTYLEAAAYLLLSGACWLLLSPSLGWSGRVLLEIGDAALTPDRLVEGFNAGNPIALVVQLAAALEKGGHVAGILPALLRNYLIFHAFIAIVCSVWAVIRLRVLALRQAQGDTPRVRRPRWRWLRPRVGAYPMLWKELFAERGLRLNVPARIVLVLLVVGSFAPVFFILYQFLTVSTTPIGTGFFRANYDPYRDLAQSMNIWVRVLGTLVACLLLLGVAARAAGCISNERDRQTLDALLTSPLESNTILFAKWLGNIFSMRVAGLWLGAIYGLGVLTRGLDAAGLPFLFTAWLIYAGVVSALGIWYSLVCRTTLRATLATLSTAVGLGVGHWVLWICCLPFHFSVLQEPAFMQWLLNFQIGLTPPAALGYAFSSMPDEFSGSVGDLGERIGFALLGLLCWVGVAAAFWVASSNRFRLIAQRQPRQSANLSPAFRPDALPRELAPTPSEKRP